MNGKPRASGGLQPLAEAGIVGYAAGAEARSGWRLVAMAARFDPQAYGTVVAELLAEQRVPPLGPGTPNAAVREALQAATVDRLFAGATVTDRAMANACRSALWLYHDFLDESHTISQSIATTTGSYWHGIMHRREPDFGNAAYWFRRVGEHPVFPHVAEAARAIVAESAGLNRAAAIADWDAWDPFAFIGLCEACYYSPGPDHDACRRIGLAEWRILFDYCYRQAIGG
jgi:hypothetical protein